MIFHKTPLENAYLIDIEKKIDERGFFARLFCNEEFAKHGIELHFIQANNSLSREAYTLRGLHYQLEPEAEVKLVRCIQGAFYDVILDMRPFSTTFGKSFGAILSADNRQMMYVPKGFAHGFITLEPNSEVLYMVSSPYCKHLERGVRWNDPYFNIDWPATPLVVSERDAAHPDYNNAYHLNPHAEVPL
ncbi:MAG: dTDP-4-dehydrorhamnose 3,5-epimerase [Parachlamydiaceae bacterium]|nr:dTDP-4-dehydrorhamnose 3,5-epimerase [Parachlamydiaceae bacterium]